MTFVRDGYVVRRTTCRHRRNRQVPGELIPYHGRIGINETFRNWWLVKFDGQANGTLTCCAVNLGKVLFPKEFAGKRVRFKVEVVRNEIPRVRK